MRRVKLFTIDALPYRQPIPVYGYRFGSRKKTLAVMGAIRGDEVQQMYTAARLVRKFTELEAAGTFAPDCGVMVDVSRGGVLKTEAVFRLLDRTAALGMNVFTVTV